MENVKGKPGSIFLDDSANPIPRQSVWVAREEVVWTHNNIPGMCAVYAKGTTITVVISDHEEPHRFDYAREFWFPEGKKIIDPSVDRVLPRQFEPLDFSVLVDPKLVNYARRNLPVGEPANGKPGKFKFKKESEVADFRLDEAPKPLDPEQLVKPPEEPQVFNPTDPRNRPGMIM